MALVAGESSNVLLEKLLAALDVYEAAPVSRYRLYLAGDLKVAACPSRRLRVGGGISVKVVLRSKLVNLAGSAVVMFWDRRDLAWSSFPFK